MKSFSLLLLCLAAMGLTAKRGQAQTLLADSLVHDGQMRTYFLFVPQSYSPDQAHPLVLNLHGAGSSGLEQIIYSRFHDTADTAGVLVLTPDALDNFWNSGFGEVPDSDPDDVGFLLALIDSVSANWSVDPDRVYSTGMSNGGYMSYRLACEAADRLAAIASVTGSMTTGILAACSPSRAVPVMQIHGTEDATVPYGGSPVSASMDQVVDFWVANNDCPEEPQVLDLPDISSEGCSVQQLRYFPCLDWSETVLLRVDGGGHTWPGAFPLPDAGCTNQDIRASNEVWLFFRRHNRANRFTGLNGLSGSRPDLRLYPNPVSVWVAVEGPMGSSYRIANALGRTMAHGLFGADAERVLTENWPAGVYWVLSEGSEPRSFSVQR
jgi:polyhydroxybutyrate depolymerase